jgi:hypothetical protein
VDINQILSSLDLGLLGFYVGLLSIIVSIVVGVYFYQRAKREKAPCWAIRTNNLIVGTKSKLPNIEITYNGQQVENISVSRLLFWNDGADTIDHSDMVRSSPLRIVGDNGATLLDATILRANNATNSFSVSSPTSENTCLLDFEYLDKGEGALIQVVHTGISSNDLKVVGAIKGVKSLRLKKLKPATPLTPVWKAVIIFGLGAMAYLLFLTRLRTIRSIPPGLEDFVGTV